MSYYVESSFHKSYAGDDKKLKKIEYEIETQYLSKHKEICEMNSAYKNRLI